MENQMCLSVTKSLSRSSNFKPFSKNKGRRGMRTPSNASTRRPSIKDNPRTDKRKMTANGKPNMKIKKLTDSDTPVTAQVKYKIPVTNAISM